MEIIIVSELGKEHTLEDAKKQVLLHDNEIYTFFDDGCTRFVYTNKAKTKVLKVQKNHSLEYNKAEFEIYNSAPQADKDLMTKTVLLPNGIIEQEFAMPIQWGGKKLTDEQRAFAVSCRSEVGWKGNDLVCFDLDEFKKY